MNHSETISKIAPAYLAAQKNIGAAKKGSVNPFFHSKYADLGAVMEACKSALNDEGISVMQPLTTNDKGEACIETILLHESGEWISGIMPLVSAPDVQKQGAVISYTRRYALQSMVFIPAEDDDGEQAMSRTAYKTPTEEFDGGAPTPRMIGNTTDEVRNNFNTPSLPQLSAIKGIVANNPELQDEADAIKTRREASDFIGNHGYKR